MKNRPFWILLTTALIFAFSPAASQAANRPFAVTLSPLVGAYLFDDSQNLDDDMAFGLAAGYNFTERWGLEGTLSAVSTSATVGSGGSVDVYNFGVNALYHYRPNKTLVPYFTAGLGGQSIHSGAARSDENLFANYGVGLKYFLTDDVGLRAEVRHVLVLGGDGVTDLYNNLMFSTGIVFQLGGDYRNTPEAASGDRDRDGVPDNFDRCPDTPKDAKADGYGCSN